MFVVYTSNCHSQNCTRRAIFGLGIDTLIANILVYQNLRSRYGIERYVYTESHIAQIPCVCMYVCSHTSTATFISEL